MNKSYYENLFLPFSYHPVLREYNRRRRLEETQAEQAKLPQSYLEPHGPAGLNYYEKRALAWTIRQRVANSLELMRDRDHIRKITYSDGQTPSWFEVYVYDEMVNADYDVCCGVDADNLLEKLRCLTNEHRRQIVAIINRIIRKYDCDDRLLAMWEL